MARVGAAAVVVALAVEADAVADPGAGAGAPVAVAVVRVEVAGAVATDRAADVMEGGDGVRRTGRREKAPSSSRTSSPSIASPRS